jgi:50S ribosomal protein L16 3-hydroxylase
MTPKRKGNPAVLGPLDLDVFLRRHWQKSPVLIRGAVPDAPDMIDRANLFSLARRDDVESRCVTRRGRRWELAHGPFDARTLARRPARNWTILVQGVNLWHAAADAMLSRFDFIPRARLDDLMVSYAVPGGGVGPHLDSYDVFLLQGHGRRRWRISGVGDGALVPGAPLKILRRFEAQYDWVLEPGDMLYLPPHVAHDGIALDDRCMTFSIGFRAPSARELTQEFLTYLQDRLDPPGRYADPDLRAQRHPASIGDPMVERMSAMLRQVRWRRADLEEFIGCYLTEPKANVFFDPPENPPSRREFERLLRARGVRLDPRTQFLYRGSSLYVNGEVRHDGARAALRELADRRQLAPGVYHDRAVVECLYGDFRLGFLHLGASPARAPSAP